MSSALNQGLKLWQDNVPSTLLKGDLKDDIWVKLPDVMIVKLNKTLYGLKSGRIFYMNF